MTLKNAGACALFLLLALSLGCGGGGTGGGAMLEGFSPAPADLATLTPGDHYLYYTLTDDANNLNPGAAVDRRFILHLPPGARADAPLDLLLFFHGSGGSAEKLREATAFGELADQEGFIVVFGQALGLRTLEPGPIDNRLPGDEVEKVPCWNSRPGAAPDETCYGVFRRPDDDGYIDRVITQLKTDFEIDRVFTSGFSNGCGYSQHLALTRPDIRAMAVGGCKIPLKDLAAFNDLGGVMPVLLMHGTDDATSDYQYLGQPTPEGDPRPSAENAIDLYATLNGCAKPATIETNIQTPEALDIVEHSSVTQVDRWTYNGCQAATVFYKMTDGTHMWYYPNRLIFWDFLSRQ